MKRIDYPQGADLDRLKVSYFNIFAAIKDARQIEWEKLRSSNLSLFGRFPKKWSTYLTADFKKLASIYLRYYSIKDQVTDKQKEQIESIFGYNRYIKKGEIPFCIDHGTKTSEIIAGFFLERAQMLKIHTCFYCDISYINAFTVSDPSGMTVAYRHFDLDHVIAQSKCPMLGLSLFNFVPSCKSCNQTIKRSNVLGDNDIFKMLRFSPSSKDCRIEKRISIDVRPKKYYPDNFIKNRGNFSIKFRCSDFYREYVDYFHLEERYDFHKDEALRLLDLRKRYPQKNIEQIARLLKRSPETISDDIFGEKFTEEAHRSFSKLRKDILTKY